MRFYYKCLGNSLNFSGRMSRENFKRFIYIHSNFMVWLGLIYITLCKSTQHHHPIVLLMFCVIESVPCLSALVRRFHDCGYSGTWALLSLVPQVASIMFVYDMMGSDALARIRSFGIFIAFYILLMKAETYFIGKKMWLEANPGRNRYGRVPPVNEATPKQKARMDMLFVVEVVFAAALKTS